MIQTKFVATNNDILSNIEALFNLRISRGGENLKMPAFVMNQFASDTSGAISSEAKQSLKNSAACILSPFVFSEKLAQLVPGDRSSFLVIPVNAIKHTFCGVIRKNEDETFSVVLVNSGLAYGHKLSIKESAELEPVSYSAIYQHFHFKTSVAFHRLFFDSETGEVSDPTKTTQQKYEEFSSGKIILEKATKASPEINISTYLLDHNVVMAWARRQKVQACYAIQPFLAIVFALETCLDSVHKSMPLSKPSEDVFGRHDLPRLPRRHYRERYVTHVKSQFPDLKRDIESFEENANRNKAFRQKVKGGIPAQQALQETGLTFERLSVDTLKQLWPKVRECLSTTELSARRVSELVYAIEFESFISGKDASSLASRFKCVEEWKAVQPKDPTPYMHELCLREQFPAFESEKQKDHDAIVEQLSAVFLNFIASADRAGAASHIRSLRFGINAARPSYPKELLKELAAELAGTHPELSVLFWFEPGAKSHEHILDRAILKLGKPDDPSVLAFQQLMTRVWG